MFQGLDESQLADAVEALLFVTDEPVGVITLADMLEVDPKLVEQTLIDLRERFEREGRGIQLREVAGGWRLYTHPAYHELVERYVLSWDTRKLSQAAMETLAIVAYLQPVTRAGVARYWSAISVMLIAPMSTFWRLTRYNSRSNGPSKLSVRTRYDTQAPRFTKCGTGTADCPRCPP